MNSTIPSASARWCSASVRARRAAISAAARIRLNSTAPAVTAITRRWRLCASRWTSRSSGCAVRPATILSSASRLPSCPSRKSAASGSSASPPWLSSGSGNAASGSPSSRAASTGRSGCNSRNRLISCATQRLARAAGLATTISADDAASASRTCADRSGPAANSARSIKIGVSRAWPGSDHASSLRCSQPANRVSAWL